MLQKSCARFLRQKPGLLGRSFSAAKSNSKGRSQPIRLGRREIVVRKVKEEPRKSTEQEISKVLSQVEYVDLTTLPIEKIVRSPIQLLQKKETLRINDLNMKKAQEKKKNLHARIRNLTTHKIAFQFLAARRLNAEIQQQIGQLVRSGQFDPVIGHHLQNRIKINPSDLTQLKYYVVYPGSPRGPYPEDDPEFYAQWAVNNAPPYLKRLKIELERMFSDCQQAEDQGEENANKDVSGETQNEVTRLTLGSAFARNHSPTEYLYAGAQPTDHANTIQITLAAPEDLPEELKVDIPYFPKNIPLERHHKLNAVYEWSLMRSFIIANKAFSGLARRIKEKTEKKPDDGNDSAGHSDSNGNDLFMNNYYPSIYGYYNLLPKSVREHPAVITATVGLERYSHSMPLQKKLDYLNMAAKASLPLPKRGLIRLEHSRRSRTEIAQVQAHCLRLN
jgi:hypothetical protein